MCGVSGSRSGMKKARVERTADINAPLWAKALSQPNSQKAHRFCAPALGFRASRCGFLLAEGLLVAADEHTSRCKTCERLAAND